MPPVNMHDIISATCNPLREFPHPAAGRKIKRHAFRGSVEPPAYSLKRQNLVPVRRIDPIASGRKFESADAAAAR